MHTGVALVSMRNIARKGGDWRRRQIVHWETKPRKEIEMKEEGRRREMSWIQRREKGEKASEAIRRKR